MEALRCVRPLLWWVPVAIATNDCVASISAVQGRSMQPTLNPKAETATDVSEVVIFDRWTSRWNHFQRGDVVVIKSPREKGRFMVKRLVALEGDVIRKSNYLGTQEIPAGHCWIEGDNPDYSHDSTTMGPVPLALVTGHIRAVVWPPNSWRLIKKGPLTDRLLRKGYP